MTLLSWDKPAKVRSTEEHNNTFVADDAPPGAYVPNMSREDAEKWRAKVVGVRRPNGKVQVEIRKNVSGNALVLMVGDNGVIKGHYETEGETVLLSTNGSLTFSSYDDFADMFTAVQEARAKLLELLIDAKEEKK